MSSKKGPNHVVVDGSNIATEGRSMPSLAQLSEAVAGFMEEYPETAITVVVDATFGHRIDKKEIPEFEAGISNNELVAPPAGAVGRGDAFVLGIADKADASVLSNDSFQEFHGDYEWLFDEGRLIGGKPVPHVGWVWVDRVPVRGPISRKATRGSGSSRRSSGGRSRRGSKGDDNAVRTGSKEASGPMPTPKSPPPSRSGASKTDSPKPEDSGSKRSSRRGSQKSAGSKDAAAQPKSAPKGGEAVNELMPFLDFVEHHPAGTSVSGTVDAYSSHGAYIAISDTGVRGYVPLRLMGDPAPRSAKSVMKIGDEVSVVVVSFVPSRRSIDCAVPDLADAAIAEAAADADADTTVEEVSEAIDVEPAATPKRAARKKAATRKKAPAKKAPAKKKSPSKKTAAKKATAKKPAAKRAPAEKQAAAKKTAAKKAPAKKAPAKKAPAKKQAAAKKTAARKSPAKKAGVKKTAAKKTAAKKKAPAKKAAADKSAARRSSKSTRSGDA